MSSLGLLLLFSCQIFPVFPTERDSIRYAIKTASVAAGHSTGLSPPIASLTLLSMEDILKAKDLSTILSAREALRMRIVSFLIFGGFLRDVYSCLSIAGGMLVLCGVVVVVVCRASR